MIPSLTCRISVKLLLPVSVRALAEKVTANLKRAAPGAA